MRSSEVTRRRTRAVQPSRAPCATISEERQESWEGRRTAPAGCAAYRSMIPPGPVIRSFRDRRTEQVFGGEFPKGFPSDLVSIARRKLRMLHRATNVGDLRSPRGNRLEALKGDRAGQHSIRVNDQFRLCFVWRNGDAFEVEITDYHD